MTTHQPVRPRQESPKRMREMIHQKRLEAIASSIDVNKLKSKPVIPVDQSGRVDMKPSHPNYKYWTEDD